MTMMCDPYSTSLPTSHSTEQSLLPLWARLAPKVASPRRGNARPASWNCRRHWPHADVCGQGDHRKWLVL